MRGPGCCVALLLVAAPALAADGMVAPEDAAPYSSPYVYQNTGHGRAMSATLQYEAGYGSRESRSFAQKGVEQGLRLRVQPWDFLGVEAFGGVVVDAHSRGLTSEAASIEVVARALDQRRHQVNLDIGAGYIYDYRHAHVPRIRLTLGRGFGRLDLSLSGLLEIPVGSAGRDDLDVMTTIAASYRVTDWLRVGGEVAAEDLEGLWDPREAEGGAKFLFGPTVAFVGPAGLFVKVNAAPVFAYVANQRPAPGAIRGDQWGFMGRVVLGWAPRL